MGNLKKHSSQTLNPTPTSRKMAMEMIAKMAMEMGTKTTAAPAVLDEDIPEYSGSNVNSGDVLQGSYLFEESMSFGNEDDARVEQDLFDKKVENEWQEVQDKGELQKAERELAGLVASGKKAEQRWKQKLVETDDKLRTLENEQFNSVNKLARNIHPSGQQSSSGDADGMDVWCRQPGCRPFKMDRALYESAPDDVIQCDQCKIKFCKRCSFPSGTSRQDVPASGVFTVCLSQTDFSVFNRKQFSRICSCCSGEGGFI